MRRAPHQGISERADRHHREPPKRIKRLLRELAAKAHEEELRRRLAPLANAFERWSRDEVDSFELSDLIHEFHQGPSRDLFVRYTTRPHNSAVACAIATGIIDRSQVTAELLEHLALALEFYADARNEQSASPGAERHDAGPVDESPSEEPDASR